MAMNFCDKCSSILQVMKIDNEKYFICLRCKFKRKCDSDENTSITENFERKEKDLGQLKIKTCRGMLLNV